MKIASSLSKLRYRLRLFWRRAIQLARDFTWFLRFCLVAGVLLHTSARAADVYIFGDSGADMGNYFALPGHAPATGSPYYRGPDGFYRLSNGPMWPELQFPSIRSQSDPTFTNKNVNFAYGGAKSDAGFFGGDIGENYPVGLKSQLDLFEARLAAGKLTVGRDTAAFLYAGTNDLFEALALQQDASVKIAGVTTNLRAAVARLAARGIKTVYVSEIVDIGEAAAFYNTGRPAAEEAALRASLNAVGAAARASMRAGLAAESASQNGKVRIVVLPLNKLFASVRANPAAFGFTNMTGAIYDDTNEKLLVTDPAKQKGYFFLDSLHTTAHAQELEGRYYRAVIEAIDGSAQRRLGRTVDGTIAGIDLVSRALAAPAAEQTLRPKGSRSWEVFLTTPLSRDRITANDGEESATVDTTAGIIGVSWPESREPALKLAFGYVDQEGRLGDRALRFKQHGPVASLYNESVAGPITLRAEVSHGWFDLKTTRDPHLTSNGSVMVARGTTNVAVDRGSIAGNHDFAFGNWNLLLEGGLKYTKVVLDPFSESGAPGLDLSIAKITHESLRASFEARVRSGEFFGDWLRFRPELSLRVDRELADAGIDVAAQLIDNTSGSVVGTASHGDRWHFTAEPRLVFPIMKHAMAVISYQVEADTHNVRQRGLWLSLNQRF